MEVVGVIFIAVLLLQWGWLLKSFYHYIINATDYSAASTNTSLIEHYCNTLGIKLPSGRYGQPISHRGSESFILSLTERKEHTIQ